MVCRIWDYWIHVLSMTLKGSTWTAWRLACTHKYSGFAWRLVAGPEFSWQMGASPIIRHCPGVSIPYDQVRCNIFWFSPIYKHNSTGQHPPGRIREYVNGRHTAPKAVYPGSSPGSRVKANIITKELKSPFYRVFAMALNIFITLQSLAFMVGLLYYIFGW